MVSMLIALKTHILGGLSQSQTTSAYSSQQKSGVLFESDRQHIPPA